MEKLQDEQGFCLFGDGGQEEEIVVSDGKKDCGWVDIWEINEGGSRSSMGEVEREQDSSRSWSRAVDMLKNGFTAPGSASRRSS